MIGSPVDPMDSRIRLLERIKLELQGHVYVGTHIKNGWKEPIPFYLFKCPIHGYVENYAKGYGEILECPLCIKEKDALNDVNENTEVMQVIEAVHYSNE
jgi:hypothetical protein